MRPRALIHAHVQRRVLGVGEASVGEVQLHRGDAQIEQDPVDQADAQAVESLGQLVVDAVDRAEPVAEPGQPGAGPAQLPRGHDPDRRRSDPGWAASSASVCPPRPRVASTATAPGRSRAGASRSRQRSRSTGTWRGGCMCWSSLLRGSAVLCLLVLTPPGLGACRPSGPAHTSLLVVRTCAVFVGPHSSGARRVPAFQAGPHLTPRRSDVCLRRLPAPAAPSGSGWSLWHRSSVLGRCQPSADPYAARLVAQRLGTLSLFGSARSGLRLLAGCRWLAWAGAPGPPPRSGTGEGASGAVRRRGRGVEPAEGNQVMRMSDRPVRAARHLPPGRGRRRSPRARRGRHPSAATTRSRCACQHRPR